MTMSQYLYLVQIRSENTGKFLIFRAATTKGEVKKIKKEYYMDEFKITRYKKDREIKDF
jgi:hypothetical protein